MIHRPVTVSPLAGGGTGDARPPPSPPRPRSVSRRKHGVAVLLILEDHRLYGSLHRAALTHSSFLTTQMIRSSSSAGHSCTTAVSNRCARQLRPPQRPSAVEPAVRQRQCPRGRPSWRAHAPWSVSRSPAPAVAPVAAAGRQHQYRRRLRRPVTAQERPRQQPEDGAATPTAAKKAMQAVSHPVPPPSPHASVCSRREGNGVISMPAYHIFSAAATGADSQNRYFFRHWPVHEASQAAAVLRRPAQTRVRRRRRRPRGPGR